MKVVVNQYNLYKKERGKIFRKGKETWRKKFKQTGRWLNTPGTMVKTRTAPTRIDIWMVALFLLLFGGGFSEGVVRASLQGCVWKANSISR